MRYRGYGHSWKRPDFGLQLRTATCYEHVLKLIKDGAFRVLRMFWQRAIIKHC